MESPDPLSEPLEQPLPLFRPEALAAQQQKFYGEILLIRPLSLALFFWVGIGISAVMLGFLLLGTYAERTKVEGIFEPGGNAGLQAELYVPEWTIKFVRSGEAILVHCQSCPAEDPQSRTGLVAAVSSSPLSRTEMAAGLWTPGHEPVYKINLTFTQVQAQTWPEGVRVRAELPVGRKPLLKWLFERTK